MGLEFGDLPVRIRKIVYYSLSPLDQRFWVKSVRHGIPNLVRRATEAIPSMAPALLLTTWILLWADKAYKKSIRKNPKLYENDT